ncbi:hypothetical protein TNCT_92111 [Trichonephila clavata]|uniref:Uncharacterized protein n=1 Tax=Trichonephila clavata TaxID=2740835 RepID=A0A8X6EY22_TRICU|nr:hypothetical protein TNCT_92111 [Trichonephila clavata]
MTSGRGRSNQGGRRRGLRPTEVEWLIRAKVADVPTHQKKNWWIDLLFAAREEYGSGFSLVQEALRLFYDLPSDNESVDSENSCDEDYMPQPLEYTSDSDIASSEDEDINLPGPSQVTLYLYLLCHEPFYHVILLFPFIYKN